MKEIHHQNWNWISIPILQLERASLMAMIIIFLAFSLLFHGSLGELICDDLPASMCSFAVASSGNRCTLETGVQPGLFECKTSAVVVNSLREHIETDECIDACGADRTVIGISSDALLDQKFIGKICSKECFENCPNIVDLYSNLAIAEGSYLPGMCKARRNGQSKRRGRSVAQLKSSSAAPVVVHSAPKVITSDVSNPVSASGSGSVSFSSSVSASGSGSGSVSVSSSVSTSGSGSASGSGSVSGSSSGVLAAPAPGPMSSAPAPSAA